MEYYEELAEKNLVEKFEAKLTEETRKLMDDAEGLIDDAAGLVDDATGLTDDVLLGEDAVDDIVEEVLKGAESGSKAGLAQYGDNFGKMGTYVENPNIKVDWSQYAEHGLERMQQRGMTQEMVDQIVANGKVLSQSNGSKYAFITWDGVAVVSKDGKLITTWSSENYDSAMKEIIMKLFGE